MERARISKLQIDTERKGGKGVEKEGENCLHW